MPIFILEEDLPLSGTTPTGNDNDIVAVEDSRVGLWDAPIGRQPATPFDPPITFTPAPPGYVPQGDEILMTRAVALDSGFVQASGTLPPDLD